MSSIEPEACARRQGQTTKQDPQANHLGPKDPGKNSRRHIRTNSNNECNINNDNGSNDTTSNNNVTTIAVMIQMTMVMIVTSSMTIRIIKIVVILLRALMIICHDMLKLILAIRRRI